MKKAVKSLFRVMILVMVLSLLAVPTSAALAQGIDEYGDAPEDAVAYPSTGQIGYFPTCLGGSVGYIGHNIPAMYFGPSAERDGDGNSGPCVFPPYDQDECCNDGDAGIMYTQVYTIIGPAGSETVVPCPGCSGTPLGYTCDINKALWGSSVDIQVQNPTDQVGFINVLIDWDQNGVWGGSSPCQTGPAPEHVLVNLPVPAGYSGPMSLIPGCPVDFKIGTNSGYVWTRFSISEAEVSPDDWDGSGYFTYGETEDYLLFVEESGTIVIEKQTNPDGSDQAFEFTGFVGSMFLRDGWYQWNWYRAPGQYTVTEIVPDCWQLTDIVCSDDNSVGDVPSATATINLEPGEEVWVTFYNEEYGTIIVEKQTAPDDSPQSFTFTGNAPGTIKDNEQIEVCLPAGGPYTVTESVPTCWDLTSIDLDDNNGSVDVPSATATINLEPGEVVTAIFYDTERGYIIVEKQTDPDGVPSTFTFAGELSGTIGDGEQLISPCLRPGDYTSWELPKPYWKLVDIMLDDDNSTYDFSARKVYFNLDPGETVTAVFTNRFIPPPEEEPPVEDHGAPVGIEVYPVDKIGLIAPWIALFAAIVAGGVFLIRRKAHSKN